jgi:Na+-transporting methylmalonyl-CoA/oxaloacetate decarboxylase gamma subunit
MNADLIIGLRIGAIGLGVTFLALGLLSIVMRWLPKLFPPTKDVQQITDEPAVEVGDDQRLEEMAVALAIGISLLEQENAFQKRDPSLGKLLEH